MNSSFSQTLPTLQFAWDSTSLGLFKECPRKYYYSIVEGYTTPESNVHLTFGIHYHKALEIYDHARSSGRDYESALRDAVRYCMVATWNEKLNRPWSSGDPYKNRETLVRSVVWYLTHFEDDPIETVQLKDGRPAVELSFRYAFPYTFSTGESALICGHLDRLGMVGGSAWIIDRKTTKYTIEGDSAKYYFQQYSPDNQMSLYTFVGKVVYSQPVQGVIIDAAQVVVTFSRFRRGFVYRTEDHLNEWLRDTKHYLTIADAYAQENYWPLNDKSCGNYGGCPFRAICSADPAQRQELLNLMYIKRTWDPLQTRGDV